MAERSTIGVPSPGGGWGAPWPNGAEIEAVLTHEKWTLVGGLMAQLHAVHRGIDAIRPTNDVDIVLHVETTRGVAAEAACALESIGYPYAEREHFAGSDKARLAALVKAMSDNARAWWASLQIDRLRASRPPHPHWARPSGSTEAFAAS